MTEEVEYDYELKSCTTLKVGGKAKVAYFPKSIGDMVYYASSHAGRKEDFAIIGAGSNLLIASDGVDIPCILNHRLKDVIQIEDNKIYAMCGAKSSAFAKVAYDAGLAGGEFLIGIPGSIGGAVYMNAGAHGQNIKDILESVKILNLRSLKVVELSAKELSFTYRSSTFMKENHVILSAIFNMPKGDKEKIKEKMDFHVNYRLEHHPPLTEYSAGSTFRNPQNEYAANLLEKVGAKEYIENEKVKFSSKHANFLYNFGDATSTDVVRLMHTMWKKVRNEFNTKLYPEIRFIGNKSEEEEKLWKIMTRR